MKNLVAMLALVFALAGCGGSEPTADEMAAVEAANRAGDEQAEPEPEPEQAAEPLPPEFAGGGDMTLEEACLAYDALSDAPVSPAVEKLDQLEPQLHRFPDELAEPLRVIVEQGRWFHENEARIEEEGVELDDEGVPTGEAMDRLQVVNDAVGEHMYLCTRHVPWMRDVWQQRMEEDIPYDDERMNDPSYLDG